MRRIYNSFEKKGPYPVYSANNSEPLAYADFFDYDGKYLTISVNGIAGKITTKSGKFSINADRIILIPKSDKIDNNYIKYVIEPILRANIKGRVGHNGENEFTKLPSGIIGKIQVQIPINDDESFNLEIQQEIAKKYRKIEGMIKNICNKIDELVSVKISLGN